MLHHDSRPFQVAVDETAQHFQRELDKKIAATRHTAEDVIARVQRDVPSDRIASTYALRFQPAGERLTIGARGSSFEQPLHPRVTLLADWFSGKNRFGYVTPGFGFSLPKNSILYTGYSIGNQGRKNNALFIYYGITF